MKTQIKKMIKSSQQKLIKVQLDYRTCITVKSMEALDMWLKKYPEAKIV